MCRLNLNTIFQEKTPETCTFHGWCFETRSIKIKNIYMLKLGWWFPPTKISGYAPGCHS